jgi:hypothetical protein
MVVWRDHRGPSSSITDEKWPFAQNPWTSKVRRQS